ncbi:MAG: type III glutamate--ammonia ligase [Rhodoferax sp.]|nr:type III glutamate--ammonia ligase [Rhodoferax sp.]
MNLDARVQSLHDQGVHTVLAQFVDIHGVAKGKWVPLGRLRDWVEVGAGFAGPSIWGTGLPRHGPRSEYHGRVQPESLQALPFMPGFAHAVCDGYAGGEPLSTCSRQLLKTQRARLDERGWTLSVGIEPEFFLLSRSPQGGWQPADSLDRLEKPSYDLKSLNRQAAFLGAFRQALAALGFDWEQIDHEDACGQFEVNYRHDEALAAADRYVLFKMVAHTLAEREGLVFSCMPKPYPDMPGSGLHFHISLADADGRAVFSDPADPARLSADGQAFVAGLLDHGDALSALCAPTVNSYRRLALARSRSGTTWAPVWKAHGENNRTCLVRTLPGRIEWRLPDPSCNVYAAMAATLAAGLDGMDRGLNAGPGCVDDLYERAAAGGQPMPPRLPRDLAAALDALEGDRALRAQLGPDFCEQFLAIKWREWDAYAGSVSDWELERYAAAF